MKLQNFIRKIRVFVVWGMLSAAPAAFAQGTIFTYQGQLTDSGAAANGTNYGMVFTVYNDAAAGSAQGSLGIASVTVSNGLFTVPLDFGNVFDGSPRWLEIKVQKNGGLFTTLNPRQQITPAPYAVFSGSASNLMGTVSASQLSGTYSGAVTFSNQANSFSGTFNGNGANLNGVDASTLGGFGSFDFWQLGGNNVASGQFLGSVNNRAVEIRVNNLRAMQFSYASNSIFGYSPNLLGGSTANSIASGVIGATIGGGGGSSSSNSIAGNFGVIAGGYGGSIGSNALESVISGGGGNKIGAGTSDSVVGGGLFNVIGTNGAACIIGGGVQNTMSSNVDSCTIAGGNNNSIQTGAERAVISGGYNNTVAGEGAIVPGGENNTASTNYSFAAGQHARAQHTGTFVWADASDFLNDFATTANNQFLIRAAGGVGIGTNHPSAAMHVASAASAPEIQITQLNSSDYTRLRMNVAGAPGSAFWEIDVTPGASPRLEFWNGGREAYIDASGNVTATSFNPTSDRNAKENFEPVNSREMLDKVAALQLTKWNFKKDAATRHIGPMAQDFFAEFGVGLDDKHIATIDADGVALAAIQGLNGKVEERMQQLERENAELKSRLEKLEQLLTERRD